MELAGLNVLDVFIALFVVVVILRGARTGFLAGVFSLVGVVVGVSAGSRVAPSLMPDGGNSIYGAGITLGSILAFAVLGEVIARTIGGSIRNRLSSPTSEMLDGFGGAVLGVALSDVQAASARTLRVRGIACSYGVEGSGWVAGRNLVVTNAHVVAGETATHIQVGGTGRRLPAKVVVFDEKNDIAVLRVNGLGLTPLRLAAPKPGQDVAVIGFPENGPLDIEPARTGP